MKQKQRIFNSFVLLFSLLFLSVSVHAQALPQYKGYVNDYANVLSVEEQQNITQLLDQLEKDTGVEVAVVITPSLQGDSLEQYAVTLFQQWGIGKKGKDNGLLLLIVTEERTFRVEVGYGLEGILNDARVGRLSRDYLIPSLKGGKYGTGVSLFLQEVNQILRGGDSTEQQASSETTMPFSFWLFFIGAALWYFFLLWMHGLTKIYRLPLSRTGKIGIVSGGLLLTLLINIVLFIFALAATFIFLHHVAFINTRRRYGGGLIGGFPLGRGMSGGGFGGFGGGMSGGGGFSGKF